MTKPPQQQVIIEQTPYGPKEVIVTKPPQQQVIIEQTPYGQKEVIVTNPNPYNQNNVVIVEQPGMMPPP